MNVDVLLNNPPSIKWYFIVGILFAGLVLGVAFVAMWFNIRHKGVQAERREFSRKQR